MTPAVDPSPVLRMLGGTLLGLALLSGPAAELVAQTPAGFEPVAAEIRETMRERGIPSVAVAAARDGEVVWEEAFGWADRERRVPATPHTPYSLASISKPMTATAVLKLAEEGRLELSDPVNLHLDPRARIAGRAGDADAATVRRVLAHTAGLPLHYQFFYEGEEPGPPSREETIRRYGNVVFPPGERFRYSNLGYGVLDHLVQRVSGRPYREYMRAEVFLPLGLTRTFIGLPDPIRDEAAVRYDPDTGEPIPWYDFDHPGASAAWSSAHDLVRFGLFHLGRDPEEGRPVLAVGTRREMRRQATPDGGSAYGLGWFVDEEYGFRTVWHTGSMPGVSTMLALFPEEDAAVVVLMNTLARDLRVEFQRRIAEVLIPGYADARRAAREERRVAGADDSAAAAGSEVDAGSGLDALRGTWSGMLHTWRGELPVRLTVRDGADVHVKIGDQLETVLDGAELRDGRLSGRLWGQVPTPDVMRRPRHRLSVELLVRDGRMRGELTASTSTSPTHYALSSYLDLRREPRP